MQNTPAIKLLKPEPRITRIAPYGYVFKYFEEKAKGIPRAAFVAALQLEGIPCDGLFYEPVYKSLSSRSIPTISRIELGTRKPLDLRSMYSCPESERAAYHEAVWFPHFLFLGGPEDAESVAKAIHKVLDNCEELRGLDHKAIRNQKLGRADRES